MFSFAWANNQKGTILNEGALVYQEPDFDAPVIDTLKRGKIYSISKKRKGPFYKIWLQKGMSGWIADTDLKLGAIKLVDPRPEASLVEDNKKKKKPFFASRYRGPSFELINYVEDTMGGEKVSTLPFIGIKFNGFDTLFEGDIYADTNIVLFTGAPPYYESLTKRSASGFIIIGNFLLQTTLPQSNWHMVYYGFGPMVKYSNLSLELPNGSRTATYSAMDLNLGVIFDVGLAFRIAQKLSLRSDIKYYWEKSQYLGIGFNLGWDF